MLKFSIANPTDDFEIVTKVRKSSRKRLKSRVGETQSSKKQCPDKSVPDDQVLQPAWDDEDDIPSKVLVRPPRALDVFSVIDKRKGSEVVGSDDETCVSFRKSAAFDNKSSQTLPYGKELGVKRLSDANRERRSMASLVSTEFNTHYRMLLIASVDSTMAFFKVDGSENALLRDRVYEDFSLSSAKFTAHGDKVTFTGNIGSFRIYDLETGSESRARRFIGSPTDETISKCFISSAHPNLVALGTNGSAVYLADLRSLEKISVMRASGLINSLCFTQDGTFLNTYGAEGSIYVFDLRTNKPRIVHRWFDQASTNGLSISCSSNSQWIACGADSGYVNVYKWSSTMTTDSPIPDKAIGNLVTRVDSLCFHPSNEILCLASSQRPDAIRLYNLNEGIVFENFPVHVGILKKPTSIGFSPGGRFLCVGQCDGRAALYALSHYKDY
ncbi:U3 small nucleolar RNA-associated protein 18 [Schistosoma japonicum]|nr:U3 small nucleolar RNA-associated protein 18 [Schistosoma japonicum]